MGFNSGFKGLNEHIGAAVEWIMSSTTASRVSFRNTRSCNASTNNTCNERFAQAQVTQYHEDFHISYSFPYWIIYNQQIYQHGARSRFEPELPIHITTLLPEMSVTSYKPDSIRRYVIILRTAAFYCVQNKFIGVSTGCAVFIFRVQGKIIGK